MRACYYAIGARWGHETEDAFRNAFAGLLADYADIQVERVVLHDSKGEVFNHPSDVELDLLIRNGATIIGEIKSSLSKGDLSTFFKKVKFYEKQKNTRADRMVVISPMVDPDAFESARRLGVEIFTSAVDFSERMTK